VKLIDKVKKDPSLLRDYSTAPIAVQRAAIEADFNSIRYIKNPNQEIQCLAVRRGGITAYKLINSPCYDAKKVLAEMQPMKINKNIAVDETLMEIAIRANTDCVATFRTIPYRLQKLARELSKPVEIINIIKDPHPDLVRDYLSENNRINSLNSVPPDVELEHLNRAKNAQEVYSLYGQLRNPTLVAQKHYVKMILAMSKRENMPFVSIASWRNVSGRIDEDLKYEILQNTNMAELDQRTMPILRSVFRGNETLMNALTILS